MSEGSAGTVSAYHQQLWGEGDRTAIDRYWSPDAVVHMTGFTGTAVDVVREDVDRYLAGFTDVRTTVLDLLEDGAKAVLRWETTGFHSGSYGDVPATGKDITMRGVDVFEVREGRIVACWSMWDGLDVYDQLGLLPPGLA